MALTIIQITRDQLQTLWRRWDEIKEMDGPDAINFDDWVQLVTGGRMYYGSAGGAPATSIVFYTDEAAVKFRLTYDFT